MFPLACTHATFKKHIVHCTSKIGCRNIKHYTQNAFFHIIFRERIITILSFSQDAPQVKTSLVQILKTCAFNPLLIILSPNTLCTETQNLIISCTTITPIISECDILVRIYGLIRKISPVTPPALITHHAPTLHHGLTLHR